MGIILDTFGLIALAGSIVSAIYSTVWILDGDNGAWFGIILSVLLVALGDIILS